jgi:hypothetical protein
VRLAERNDFMPRATQPVVQQQHQVPPKQGQRGLRGTHEKIVSDFALFWRSRIRVRYRTRGCYLSPRHHGARGVVATLTQLGRPNTGSRDGLA